MRSSAAAARYEQAAPRPSEQSRPTFEVLRGSGLDSLARAGIGRVFLRNAKMIVAIIVAVCVLGVCRVGIYAMSAGVLNSTAAIRSDVEDARVLESNLQIEHSTLSSSGRIDRIATQNYGMVKATETEVMSLSDNNTQGIDNAQLNGEVDPESSTTDTTSEQCEFDNVSPTHAGVSEG